MGPSMLANFLFQQLICSTNNNETSSLDAQRFLFELSALIKEAVG